MNDRGARIQQVYVVVPPRVLLLDIAGPVEVLRRANIEQEITRFDVTLISPERAVSSSIGVTLAGIGPLPDEVPETAWIVLPGNVDRPLGRTVGDDEDSQAEGAIVEWLRRVVRSSHTIVTICSGAIYAGRAGLLDGRACTTHEASIDALRTVAPRARVITNRLFVGDGPVWSSAGVTSGTDLMLHLVAGIAGDVTASAVARYLVVYFRRSGADPQISPWVAGRSHLHAQVHAVQDAIVANPSREWTVDDLAEIAATSSRNLSRLFREHAGSGVVEYLTRIRLAAARDLVIGTDLPLDVVAARCGFGTTRHFRRAWQVAHGRSPRASRLDLRS